MTRSSRDRDPVPYSVAYPASYAKDEELAASDRVDNVFFAGYQAVRTTALLLLADYLESSEVCPRVSDAIRGLRLPHWREWVELATMLAKFWRGDFEQKPERPTRFPALMKAWLETAYPLERRTDGHWPTLLSGCLGLRGPAKGPVDALWYARNHRAHGTGTRTGDTGADAALLKRLLPLLDALIAALFPRKSFDLYRRFWDDGGPGLRVIRLHGPHKDRRFEAEPLGEEWASAFDKTGLVAIAGGEPVVIHPLFLPRDPDLSRMAANGGGLLEDLYLVDSVSEKKVVALGVLDQRRLSEGLTADVTAALKRKQVELGLDRTATHRWNLVDWTASTAGRLIADLTGRKYFPDFYYERPDVDGALRRTLELDRPPRASSTATRGRALLLLGEAGSGKSSLLCRLVDELLKKQAKADVDGEGGKPGRGKRGRHGGSASLSRYLEGRGGGDVVLYLAGAAAYGGDADKGADALLCDAIVRQGGVLTGAFGTLEHFVTKLDESAAKDGQNADRNPDRKVWIILDGLNEADRFKDLVRALDRFLPQVAQRPWLRLVVSVRSGAFHELERKDREAMIHAGAVFRNASYWAPFPSERPDAFGRKQDVPYLEVRPFAAGREGAEAYRKRQDWPGGRSAGIRYEDLPPGVKTLLLSPLHLHLFHETWAGHTRIPVDLEETGLFEAFLTRLTNEHPGLEERLEMLAEVMMERRESLLPIEVAEKWEEEAGRRAASNAARLAKLSPVEELVAASILMRPVEEGQGSQRRLIGYRFSHQSLGSAVLASHLRRRLGGRPVPTAEELLGWAREASGEGKEEQEPFVELVDAVATFVVACTRAGDGMAVATLLDLESDEVRKGLVTTGLVAYGSLRGSAGEAGEASRRFWESFAPATRLNSRATRYDDACWEAQSRDEATGYSRAASEIGELRLELMRELVAGEPGRLDWKRDLVVSLNRLSELRVIAGRGSEAERLAEESLELMRELAAADPGRLDWKRALAVSLSGLSLLRASAGRGPEAEKLAEGSLGLMRELVATEPGRLDWKWDLTVLLNHLSDLRDSAGRGPEAERLAEESLELMRELVAAESGRLDWKQELTVSLNQVSDLRDSAGRGPEAERLAEESLELMRELVAADPGRLDWRGALTASLNRVIDLRLSAGRGTEAERLAEESQELTRGLVAADPMRLSWKRDLVASLGRLIGLRASAGRGPEAERLAEGSLGLMRELVAADSWRLDWKRDLVVSLNLLSDLRVSAGRGSEAERLVEESLELMRELVAAEPGRLDWRGGLTASLNQVIDLRLRAGRGAEAERLAEESLELTRGLVAADPMRLSWKRGLVASLGRLIRLRASAGRGPEAERLAEGSLGLMRELVAADPGRLDWKRDLALSLSWLSHVRANVGRGPEAERLAEESLELMRELVAADPGRLDWKGDLAFSVSDLSHVRAGVGWGPEAEKLAEESLELMREQVAAQPAMLDWKRNLTVLLNRLSHVRASAGRGPEAERLAEESLELMRELVAAESGRLDWKQELAILLNWLMHLRASAGRGPEAERLAEESLELRRELVATEPENLNWKSDLTVSLSWLSHLRESAGRISEAERLAEESHEVRRELVATEPGRLDWKRDLTFSLSQLSELMESTGRTEEAKGLSEEVVDLRRKLVEADPERLDWKWELTVALNRLSELLESAGKFEEALRRSKQDVRLTRELVEAEPGRMDWRRDLTVSLSQLSGLLEKAGKGMEAQRVSQERAKLLRELGEAERGQVGRRPAALLEGLDEEE